MIPKELGIEQDKGGSFEALILRFMQETGVNPLQEEYIIEGNKIIKKGMSMPLFLSIMAEIEKNAKKEAALVHRRKKW